MRSAPPSAEAERRRPLVHGRRIGRPLNKRRQTALDEGMARIGLAAPPPGGGIDPVALFPAARRHWLEIGFGNGEHLLSRLSAAPDAAAIGCEPFLNGVSALLAALPAELESRVKVVADDARPLLDALTPGSLDRIYLLYADPWPKKRHAKRRFLGPDNLPRLARALRSGGGLYVASDHPVLQEWIDETMATAAAFRPALASDRRPEDWPATRYEQKALAAGRSCRYWIFERI